MQEQNFQPWVIVCTFSWLQEKLIRLFSFLILCKKPGVLFYLKLCHIDGSSLASQPMKLCYGLKIMNTQMAILSMAILSMCMGEIPYLVLSRNMFWRQREPSIWQMFLLLLHYILHVSINMYGYRRTHP